MIQIHLIKKLLPHFKVYNLSRYILTFLAIIKNFAFFEHATTLLQSLLIPVVVHIILLKCACRPIYTRGALMQAEYQYSVLHQPHLIKCTPKSIIAHQANLPQANGSFHTCTIKCSSTHAFTDDAILLHLQVYMEGRSSQPASISIHLESG